MMIDPQLGNLTVTGEELALIRVCLDRVRQEIDTTSVLLLDRGGQVITSYHRRGAPPEVTVGALLAGTFAGSRELAKVMKETNFRTLIQQGDRESIFAELVGEEWILAVIYSRPTLLGMVKVISDRAVGELEEVLKQVKLNSRERDRVLSDQMRASLGTTLDMLFGDLEKGGPGWPEAN